jgi:hypothetical protein
VAKVSVEPAILPGRMLDGASVVCPDCGWPTVLVSTSAERSNAGARITVGVVCPQDGKTFELSILSEGDQVWMEADYS